MIPRVSPYFTSPISNPGLKSLYEQFTQILTDLSNVGLIIVLDARSEEMNPAKVKGRPQLRAVRATSKLSAAPVILHTPHASDFKSTEVNLGRESGSGPLLSN